MKIIVTVKITAPHKRKESPEKDISLLKQKINRVKIGFRNGSKIKRYFANFERRFQLIPKNNEGLNLISMQADCLLAFKEKKTSQQMKIGPIL